MSNVIDFAYYKATGKVRRLSEEEIADLASLIQQDTVSQEAPAAQASGIAFVYYPRRKTSSKKPSSSEREITIDQLQDKTDWVGSAQTDNDRGSSAAQCVTHLHTDGTCDFLMSGMHKNNAIDVAYAMVQGLCEAFRKLLR